MIKKYYVSNYIETSIWKIFDDKKKLRMAGSDGSKNMSVTVEYTNFTDLKTTEFAVNDTTKLLKMLNALDEEIKLETKTDNNDKIYSLVINSTNNIEMEYVTADINVIRANKIVQIINKDPNQVCEVEIIMDNDFVSTYIAATSALSDSENVVFKMNKDNKLEMIIGYVQGANKTLNTSKIKYLPKTVAGKDVLPEILGFKSEYLKQILLANKDAKDPILQLGCYNPIAYMTFTNADITSDYHLRGIVVK